MAMELRFLTEIVLLYIIFGNWNFFRMLLKWYRCNWKSYRIIYMAEFNWIVLVIWMRKGDRKKEWNQIWITQMKPEYGHMDTFFPIVCAQWKKCSKIGIHVNEVTYQQLNCVCFFPTFHSFLSPYFPKSTHLFLIFWIIIARYNNVAIVNCWISSLW